MDKVFTANGATDLPIRKAEHGVIETDFLIVGTGPAGGALACFLASHGLNIIQSLINNANHTQDFEVSLSAIPQDVPTHQEHISRIQLGWSAFGTLG